MYRDICIVQYVKWKWSQPNKRDRVDGLYIYAYICTSVHDMGILFVVNPIMKLKTP